MQTKKRLRAPDLKHMLIQVLYSYRRHTDVVTGIVTTLQTNFQSHSLSTVFTLFYKNGIFTFKVN